MGNLLRRYRYSILLIRELVITDFKLRYQGSFLGYLWSLLKPLAIFLIMYVVFLRFLKFNYGVPHTAVYLFVGIVLWSFFTEMTTVGISAIVGREDLIRKINFPRYVLVFSVSFSAVINLMLNFVVVGIFMLLNHVAVTSRVFMLIPLVGELYILALAVAFMLSALFVRLRDVNYIWDVVLQALFYAIPVIYPLTRVPQYWAKLLLLNPLAQIVQDVRYTVVTTRTPTISSYWHNPYARLIPIVAVILLTVMTMLYFRARSKFFAEEV
ncbi:MAG TPA: ABC transporter permease [Candidatus Saccharimonadales bacterium]|nr:ABC transporter permease [Candidatus Saccharimonadales bacterium]